MIFRVIGAVIALAFVIGGLQRLGVPPKVTIAGLITAGLGLGLAAVGRWVRSQWWLVRIGRFLSGAAHHGKPITDAGVFRPGQKALTATGHATRWWHLPRWKRAAHRTGGTLGVIGLIAGYLMNPVVTLAFMSSAVLATVSVGGWVLVNRLRTRSARRGLLVPAHRAAHEIAGIPRAQRADSWITVTVVDGAVRRAEVKPGPGWAADPKDEKRLESVLAARLGIEAPKASWMRAGPVPLLTLTHSPPPPGHVKMADLLGEMAKCGPDELLIGVGKDDAIVRASLATDSPHIAISMGTGAGKSNLAGWLLLQVLLRSGIGLVLDAKRRLSYPWILKDEKGLLVPLPNVAYAWTTAQLHACMSWLSVELDRRGDVAFAGMDATGKVRANVGARMFTLAEELNMAVPRLRTYWTENRGPGDPAKSPAFTGLGEVAFAGRQVRKHLVLIGQMLTAEATGSRDSSVKENCGIKFMARYGPKGWRTMAEDIPMPPAPTDTGRVQLVTAGGAREVQTPELDPVEARRMVLAAPWAPLPAGMPCAPRLPVTDAPELTGGGFSPADVTVSVTGPGVGPMSLKEIVDKGLLRPGTSLGSLKMERFRKRGEFPERVGERGSEYLYDPAAVVEFDAGRR